MDARKFIFPAILIASLAVFLFTRLLYSPQSIVLADNNEPIPTSEPLAPMVSEDASQAATAFSGCSLPASFPDQIQQWCEPITSVAAYYGIDPRLVAAVMLQESGGNPEAYSKSGAVGLMQVMPRDGLAADFMCVNGPCFSARPSMNELFDPHFNIDFGVKLLSGLITKFSDIREGLRAYGPMDRGYYYADLVLDIYDRYQ